MRTRNWIALISLCAVLAAAVLVGQHALATPEHKAELDLHALSPIFPIGGEAQLEVLVSPEALGGYAHLTAKVAGETYEVLTFQIHRPGFVLTVPVPGNPELMGRRITYQYSAFAPDGRPLGLSKKAGGIVEPEFE
jgi:hypothetical protein